MKRLLLTGATALMLLGSSAAMARVDVGINIGVPGVFFSEPDYYYPPPPVRYVERPRVVVVPERIYTPVPVYRPRYYREDYRGYREYRGNRGHDKHWKHRRDRDD